MSHFCRVSRRIISQKKKKVNKSHHFSHRFYLTLERILRILLYSILKGLGNTYEREIKKSMGQALQYINSNFIAEFLQLLRKHNTVVETWIQVYSLSKRI